MNISVLLTLLLTALAANADSIVLTTSGPVRGATVASGEVEAYLGIPYAEPPVGPLRFKKPVPKRPWKYVYQAHRLPNSCIQMKLYNLNLPDTSDTFSEDCLYLNLWVPQLHNRTELKPVIIFIHGGAFMLGSSSQKQYDGSSLAKHGDIILATINYRLGGLGFFTGFNDDAPGNVGMHDQVAAIRWIKENAENFQGDPNNIVIMGESAGSFSVSALLLSPLSKSLFRRAVLLSGSIVHPATSDNNTGLSKICQSYATFLGCTANGETLDANPTTIVECMQNLPAEKFAEADAKIVMNSRKHPKNLYSQMFFPRVGDDFLPENTIQSLRKGNFKDSEIFIGIDKDEGPILLAIFTPKLFGIYGGKILTPTLNKTITAKFMRDIIQSEDVSEDDKIIQAYLDRVNEEEEYAYVKALGDISGDYTISCGAIFQADIQSLRNNSIYFYMFEYLSPKSPTTLLPKWIGVPHGEELQYIFGNFHLREYTEKDKEIARDLLDRLVAFVKTGNPNTSKGVNWPKYSFGDPKYLEIGEQETVKTKPNLNRCEVWRKRFGAIIDDDLIRNLNKTKS